MNVTCLVFSQNQKGLVHYHKAYSGMSTAEISPKGQVCEEGDREEDGRDSTSNVCDKSKDGGLDTAGYRLSGEVLWGDGGKQNREVKAEWIGV